MKKKDPALSKMISRGKWILLKWKILALECEDSDTFFSLNFPLFAQNPQSCMSLVQQQTLKAEMFEKIENEALTHSTAV